MDELRKIGIFCKEYPPHVYGGAGVHVEHLARALSERIAVEVRCFGDQRIEGASLSVRGFPMWEEVRQGTDPRFVGAIDAAARSLVMAKERFDGQVAHGHTWYAGLATHIAGMLWDVPTVVTIHSLEPLRPWKAEQLGNAYRLSCWIERTAIEQADAVIAVSGETRADVLRLFDVDPDRVHVIHNGIDLDLYRPVEAADALERRGIDRVRPYVLFVGRIARQKGILHLLDAIPALDPSLQVVLCAGAPDTPEIARETRARAEAIRGERGGLIWIEEMLPRAEMVQLYTHAAVFCCPSVYEPFGIINLEAMACGTAVVATAVGGIKEVVVPEETGILVDPGLLAGTFEPTDPERFASDLAAAIDRVALDVRLRERLGRAGRARAEARFGWPAIAARTIELYRSLL